MKHIIAEHNIKIVTGKVILNGCADELCPYVPILSQQLSFFYACLRDIDTGSPVTVSAKEKYILPLTAADIEKRGGTHGRIERKYLHAERCRLCPPIIFRRLIKFIIGRRKDCGVMSY